MRRFEWVLILSATLAPRAALAKPQKLSLEVNNGQLVLAFDPAKISEAELRGFAQAFAPETTPDAILTDSLESCHDTGGKVGPCPAGPHTPAQPAFFRDADLTLAANAKRVTELAGRAVPKELEPAKEWVRRHDAFMAGLETHKLAYYKSWKTADLTSPIESVDGGKACAAIVAKLDAASSKDVRYGLARNEWHNCMVDRAHAAMGEYPAAPWKAFLKARGITSKFAQVDGE